MDKAQRLDYGESLMTHAMVFQGVDLDERQAHPLACGKQLGAKRPVRTATM